LRCGGIFDGQGLEFREAIGKSLRFGATPVLRYD
jgi:hypothetical protein